MSRTLKWVLGILAVLVVLAVVGGVVWAWQNRALMMSYRPSAVQPNNQGVPNVPNGQNSPFGPRGFGRNGFGPMNGFGFRGPMMRGMRGMWGFGPFGMGFFYLGGLLRLILPLGILALVAFLFYQLGRRSGLASPPVSRAAPVAPQSASADQNPPKNES
jgi:hypothetical protein